MLLSNTFHSTKESSNFIQPICIDRLNKMPRLSLIEYILIGSLLTSVLVSGYLTFVRLVYGIRYISYDAWIFGMNLAMILQIYENNCDTK